MPIMEISVIPIGTKSTSISKYVASSERALQKRKAIKGQITAMGTIVESGSLSKLFEIAQEMHWDALAAGAKRVLTNISIDDRRDKKVTIEDKVNSIRKKLHI